MAITYENPNILPSGGNVVIPKTYTSTVTGTSGTTATYTWDVNIQPTGNSTGVYFPVRIQANYNSNFNMQTGGYVCPLEVVVNIQGTGTHDKVVGQVVQINAAGTGAITSLVGIESEIASIAAGCTIGNYVAYYFPNLAGVPNIGNITNFYSYAIDHVNSASKNAGRTLNGNLYELVPAHHMGMTSGRYYSAPHNGSISTAAVAANVIYAEKIFIPTRKTLTNVGFGVSVAHNSNARMCVFTSVDGKLGNLVVQTGEISCNSTGEKSFTVNQMLDAGTYFLCALFQGTPTVYIHSMDTSSQINNLGAGAFNTASDLTTYYNFAYGPFPSSAGVISYSGSSAEPHLWFKVA